MFERTRLRPVRRTQATIASIGIVLGLLSPVIVGVSDAAPTAQAAPRPLQIDQIGDSYSAGNGAGGYADKKCLRSANNWGSQYAKYRKSQGQPVIYTNRACSGSTTSTYASGLISNPDGAQATKSPGGAQFSALTSATDMALMTFGGNDVGFVDIVTNCLALAVNTAGKARKCQKNIQLANDLLDDTTAKGVGRKLEGVLVGARGRVRSDTAIVLMGYPELIDRDCRIGYGSLNITKEILALSARADQVQSQVATRVRTRTRNANTYFIKVSDIFAGRGPAPRKATPANCWHNDDTMIVEPYANEIKMTWFHPNRDGQEMYSNLLAEKLPNWTPASWRDGGGSVGTPRPGNRIPTAAFSYARVSGAAGRVSLDAGASSDPDGSITKYEWIFGGKVFASGRTATGTFGSNRAPSVTLRVTDNGGATANVTKTLGLPNRAPTFTRVTPGGGEVLGHNRPTLSAAATDPDGDRLTYSYRITGYQVDRSSGPVSGAWTVPASILDPGHKYTWTVKVSDGNGASASLSRSLTIAMLPTASDVIATPSGKGYWQVATDGGVFSFGDAQFYGSVPGLGLKLSNIMGMARTPSGKGYWLVGSDGGVFSFGDAGFHGSLPGQKVRVSNIVGMVPTKSGRGYWLAGADGGVFSFGDAQFYGSMGGKHLNAPVENISATASGQGYWLIARDGGVFSFGDAPFYGSMGGRPLSYPMVDMDVTPDGRGYWLTAEDGGVFAFGNAPFHGSLGGQTLNGRVTGMSVTPNGQGYWLNACDGGVFAFGNAPFLGRGQTYMCRGTNQG